MSATYGMYQPGMEALFYGVIMVWTIVMSIAGMVGLAIWVFKSLAMYQLAKRRGIANALLSWIPVGHDWILGSISDQYQYLVRGKVCNKRKLLLWFSIGAFISGIASTVLIISLVSVANFALSYTISNASVIGMSMSYVVALIFAIGLGITAFVFRCISKYDLYRSCEPKNAVAYFWVGLFVVITDPIFLWICRNKDAGMPPRKPEYQTYVEPENPTYL